ncbi:MAG: hypothetical protein ABFD18_19460, partial [Syntrophomonas sp.]
KYISIEITTRAISPNGKFAILFHPFIVYFAYLSRLTLDYVKRKSTIRPNKIYTFCRFLLRE